MDEQRLRSVLAELADGDASLPVPDPAHVFDRGRRLRLREHQVVAASVAVAIVLVGATVAGFLLTRPHPGGLPGIPAAESVTPTPSVRIIGPTNTGNPTMTSLPSANLSPPLTSVSPLPKPDQPAAAGPFCGWSGTLPGTVEQLLPHVGTWSAPLQVAGICGASLGARMSVTVGGKTGTVMVVMSTESGDPKKGACVTNDYDCAKTANGYVGWRNSAGGFGSTGAPSSEARYQSNNGLLIDITGINQVLDEMENPAATQAQPAMDAPPFNGQQLAVLAEQLATQNWQLQQQH